MQDFSGRCPNSLYTTPVSLIDDTGVVYTVSVIYDTAPRSRHTSWVCMGSSWVCQHGVELIIAAIEEKRPVLDEIQQYLLAACTRRIRFQYFDFNTSSTIYLMYVRAPARSTLPTTDAASRNSCWRELRWGSVGKTAYNVPS